MAKTYTPQRDSVAYRVLEYFAVNPLEELTVEDIATKFNATAVHVHTLLAPAIHAGMLRRVKTDLDYLYKLGDLKSGIKPQDAGKPSASSASPLTRAFGVAAPQRKIPEAFTIDLDQVEVESDVPMPAIRGRKPVDWTPLFKKMQPGQSCLLPARAYYTLAKQCTDFKKAGGGAFSIRKLSESELRLWRVE